MPAIPRLLCIASNEFAFSLDTDANDTDILGPS